MEGYSLIISFDNLTLDVTDDNNNMLDILTDNQYDTLVNGKIININYIKFIKINIKTRIKLLDAN